MIRIRLGFGLRDTIDSSTASQVHGPAGLGASASQLRSCAASGIAYKGMTFRVCVAPQLHGPAGGAREPHLHGPAGLGASAPQLRGFRDFFNHFRPISETL